MAQSRTIPILGPDYAERSINVNPQRTVNFWPRVTKPGSKSPIVLYPTPGHDQFTIAGSGPNRGNGKVFGGKAYMVSGNKLYSLTTGGLATEIGTLNTSGGRIEMAAGRDYLMIVDGTNGYSYDGTTFAVISDADYPDTATHVTIIDGYFVVNNPGTDEFYISATEDPTSWNALDFGVAATKPDDCNGLAGTHKDLYILGSASVQVYYNSGNPDFPFSAYSGGTLHLGLRAPHSLTEGSIGLMFLATTDEGGIFIAHVKGFSAQNISDDIQSDLDGMSTVDDAIGVLYRIGGRTLYRITFPTEQKTFEYIVEDGFWIERKSYGYDYDRMNGHVYLGTKNLFGDSLATGKIYVSGLTDYDDDGSAIERIRRTQILHMDGKRISIHELRLEVEPGVGLVTGQGSDPQLMMRYSVDNGKTWSNELWVSIGKIGEYGTICAWHKLGQAPSFTFEFKMTDPVKFVPIAGYADITIHND